MVPACNERPRSISRTSSQREHDAALNQHIDNIVSTRDQERHRPAPCEPFESQTESPDAKTGPNGVRTREVAHGYVGKAATNQQQPNDTFQHLKGNEVERLIKGHQLQNPPPPRNIAASCESTQLLPNASPKEATATVLTAHRIWCGSRSRCG